MRDTVKVAMTAAWLAVCLLASSAQALDLPAPQSSGLSLSSLKPLEGNPRLWSAMVTSTVLSQPVEVAIHLPADYNNHPERRYPVLLLFHGHGEPLDGVLPWVRQGNAPALIEASAFEGIVVIPQCGKACWYVDWQKATPGGAKPQWETYYAQQLMPWIEANFRTIATREGRAIAGLSMGGTGALAIAGRNPQLFSKVGSFSSAPNIQDFTVQQMVIANTVTLGWGAAYTSLDKGAAWRARDVQDLYGPYSSDGWRSHNPYALAPVYAREKIALYVYAGGGGGSVVPDILESGVGPYNDAFHKQLNAQGVPHRYCRGTGKHTYTYWQADLVDFLGVLAGSTPATCPNGWGLPKP